MKLHILYILFPVFTPRFITTLSSSKNNVLPFKFKYTLTTKLLYPNSPAHPITKRDLKILPYKERSAVTDYLKYIKSTPKFP